jgi:hypothetical protein
MDSEY